MVVTTIVIVEPIVWSAAKAAATWASPVVVGFRILSETTNFS
jgi:hypothetical protein